MAASIFAGRSYLVTGASSGIGLAIAQSLAAAGARLVLLARNEDRLRAVHEKLGGEGHTRLVCDLSREDGIPAALDQLRGHGAPLDGAVLSAGAHLVRPFHLSKAQHFRDMLSANVETAVQGAQIFLKNASKDGGSLVLVSSAAAARGGGGVSAYSAAKGALISLGRSLAVELAPKKIRVNTLVPGVVMTAMTERFFGGLPPAQVEAIRAAHPLGVGAPEDVAAAAKFLLSPDSRWITGTELTVDGGLTGAGR